MGYLVLQSENDKVFDVIDGQHTVEAACKMVDFQQRHRLISSQNTLWSEADQQHERQPIEEIAIID